MKKHIHLSLISVLLLGLSTSPVRAGDDEAIAAIGGFVAGIITGVIVDDHDDRVRVTVHDDYRGRHDCRKGRCHHDRHYHGKGHRSGHWEVKRIKIWVPGYWDVRYDRCGDRIKVWRKGYYKWRKERVWVAYGDYRRHDRYDDRERRHHRGYRG